jgi:hypothetical protein
MSNNYSAASISNSGAINVSMAFFSFSEGSL